MSAKSNPDEIIKLQIPMRRDVKDKANEAAKDLGFGSIQEVVRLFVAGFVRGEYEIGFTSKSTKPADTD